MSSTIRLSDQLKGMPKDEAKEYLRERLKFYRSGPEGCLSYIEENICLPRGDGIWVPIDVWGIQKRLVWDMIDFLFDMDREVFVLLGSRQCGKTTTMNIICDYLITMFGNYSVTLLHADAVRGGNCLNECKNIINNKCAITRFNSKINRSMLLVLKNSSRYQVIPTQKSSKKGSTDTGRSLTSKLLWLDEAAMIRLADLEASLWPITSQAFIACREFKIPFGIVMSSTANGRTGVGKRFYEFWKMAEENMGDDGISAKGPISGFRLHYSQIPGKDENWVKNQKLKSSERDFNQEYDCVFLGGQESFFGDDIIKNIQQRVEYLNSSDNLMKPDILRIVTSSGYICDAKLFKPIIANNSYIVGIDVSKGAGMDYHVAEVFDYNTLEQVIEIRDNKPTHTDFVDIVHYLIKNVILCNNGRCVIAIENNLGYSLITDLFKIDSMYKSLIYRDTIGADFKAGKTSELTKYSELKWGIATSVLTRPMILDNIYRFVAGDLNNIYSVQLLNEIESLEVKDGKIEGAVHDDMVFGLGMLLLLKDKGRISCINDILNSCEDFWITGLNGGVIDKNQPKESIVVSDGYDNVVSPMAGMSMSQGIAMMSMSRINTGTTLSVSGRVLSSEFSQDVSNLYSQEQAMNQVMMSLYDGSTNKAKMNEHEPLSKTFEKMDGPDKIGTDEEEFKKNWGLFI